MISTETVNSSQTNKQNLSTIARTREYNVSIKYIDSPLISDLIIQYVQPDGPNTSFYCKASVTSVSDVFTVYVYELFRENLSGTTLLEKKALRNTLQYTFSIPMNAPHSIGTEQNTLYTITVTAISYFSVKTTVSALFLN